jgi:putative intracellular protease/amidase
MNAVDRIVGDHRQAVDTVNPKNILMVVANPSRNPKLGWPLGFWASELAHPYLDFTDAGHRVTVASPDGGKVEVDSLSDPRDPSRWSVTDLISLGFLSSADCAALLEDTPKLSTLDLDRFDALVVCGGQSPMFTFRDNADLHRAIRTFFEAKKPTAVLCHGVAALVDCTLSDGSHIVQGRTVTGFANVEEDYSDQFVGQQVMPWRLEDALKARGANYVMAGRFKAFAVRDGQLITGQQHYSGKSVGQMVLSALGG